MEITKERILAETNLAIHEKESVFIRRINDEEIILVIGKYDFSTDDWICPRISARLKISDA